MKGYQHNFSDMHQDIYFDAENRARKADKMLRILRDHLGDDLKGLHALDVGCSTGGMSRILGEHFGRVTGIDIDTKAIEHANTNFASTTLDFRVGDAMATGLPPDSIDVVICAHVYEHVPDAGRMLVEIHRLLKPGQVRGAVAAVYVYTNGVAADCRHHGPELEGGLRGNMRGGSLGASASQR